MAGDIATRYVRIRPDTTGFKQETNKQVEQALAGVKKSIAAAIGGAGLFEVVKSTFDAASGKQSAAAQIEQTVKNAGAAWTVYGKTVDQILEDQETKTGFDFEEQAQAFGRLEQQFKNTPKALDALNSAMDIARARHADLATVAVSLSRAEAGNTQSLSRLGIVLPKYTAQQDALAASLADVKAAEEAQAQAREKNYTGTIHLSAAQLELSKLSATQLKQREADLKSQVAAAAASDKSVGATQALLEVQRRYSGQTETFLQTAQGGAARFHVSIQQLQETIGTAFLPEITHAANVTADWIDGLSKSETVQHGAATAARDVAEAVGLVASGVQKLEPLAEIVQTLVNAFGVGPLLGFIAAVKIVPGLLTRIGVTEAGLTADTVALQGSIDGVQAGINALSAEIAAATAPTATLEVEMGALTEVAAAAAAAQTSLFEATEQLAGAQLQLTSSAELAIAAEGTLGTVTAGTIGEHEAAAAAIAAETLAIEAEATAATEATVASGAFAAALFGPLGLIVGAGLLTAGLIYLSQQQSVTAKATDMATDAFTRQEAAARRAKQAVRDATTARASLPAERADLAAARASLNSASAERDTVYGSGTASDSDIARVDAAVVAARARVSAANKEVLATEQALKGAVDAGKKARDDERKSVESIIKTQLTLIDVRTRQSQNEVAASRGLIGVQAQVAKVNPALQAYVKGLEDASAHTKGLSDTSRDELAALAGFAKGLGRFPTEKEIKLVLDTKGFTTTLDAAKQVWDSFLSNNFGGAGARGGESATVRVKAAGGQLGKDAASSFSTAFVTHIDVSGIGTAFTDSLSQAQQNIIQQGGALADSVASILDERLRRTTVPLTAQIKAIQDSLDAESAAKAARDAGTAVQDAQAKLDQLRSVYGSGALTSGQSTEIRDAQNAVTDAQQTITDQQKQARIKGLQDEIDAAGKAEELRKAAATRNLADLSDELSRGKISQEQYLTGVREILGRQQVTFKNAGKLLGSSFADGFQDALSSAFAQAGILGGLGKATLAGAAKGTKPSNPKQDEAKAIQAVIDQIAGSGGKFTLDGKLPKGVSLGGLVSAAQEQRRTDSYREVTQKQGAQALTYAQQTADHLATAVHLLRNGQTVHVVVDGQKAKAKTRATTKATQS